MWMWAIVNIVVIGVGVGVGDDVAVVAVDAVERRNDRKKRKSIA